MNAKNLEALGTERLAELVMTLVQGSAPLKREARAAMLETAGSEAVAAEVRKRLATVRRSKSYVDSKKRKALLRDLTAQRDTIVNRIGPADAPLGFELLWQFLELGPFVFERLYHGWEPFDEMFVEACGSLGPLAVAAKAEPVALAGRIAGAVSANYGFGMAAALLAALFDALGKKGRKTLREALTVAARSGKKDAHRSQQVLMILADLEEDVDAWVAEIPPELARQAEVSAQIAIRYLKAGRATEALAALDAVGSASSREPDWVDARVAALDVLDRGDEAQTLRWRMFEANLDGGYLRGFIERLPDFDDVEAEDRGLDFVEAQKNIERALRFLIDWPALDRAARLVLAKREVWDGNMFHILSPAADELEARYPLSATVLRRAMIEDTLSGGKSNRYKHAARHLLECESADAAIEDYGSMAPHERFVARLRDRHGRKYAFWDLVEI